MRKVALLPAIIVLAFSLAGCGGKESQGGLSVSHTVDIKPPQVTLLFAGDLMLARTPGQYIARGEDPFAAFAAALTGADLAIGNLECVIATGGQRVPKAYNFRCDPQTVPLLDRYFGAVSVANNHSGDYGKAAFAEELGLLRQGGPGYFGGGLNDQEAHSPLLVQRKGFTIALLGYDEVELKSYAAGPATPGVAWSEDDERVLADIAAAKARADVVVVFPHWGLEYHPMPSQRQRGLARAMIDAGADLVVGSHPHVTEGAELYKNRLIVYSLGNFVFDDWKDVPADMKEPARTSWLLKVSVGRQGLVRWSTTTARTDDRGFPQPVPGAVSPCGSTDSPEIQMCGADGAN